MSKWGVPLKVGTMETERQRRVASAAAFIVPTLRNAVLAVPLWRSFFRR